MVKITNQKQFKTLVELMEKNPSLAKGFQRGVLNVDTKVEWDSIALTLNSLGPPSRDGKEWQKVWSDIKFKVKKKLLHNKKECEVTGGGTFKQKYLSDLEEVVSNLLSYEKMISPKGKVLGGAQTGSTPKSSTSAKNHPCTSTSTSASFIRPSTPNPATSSSNQSILTFSQTSTPLAPSRIIDINDAFCVDYTDFSNDQPATEEIQNIQLITEIEHQSEVSTQVDQNRRKLSKLTDKNSLLQKQTNVQEKLYEEVKEYLKRIDNHLKENTRYERKRFYLEEEKLKLYRMQLEREETRAIEENKIKMLDLEIRKRKLDIEEQKMHLESSKENKP